jgi:DNA ligase 1
MPDKPKSLLDTFLEKAKKVTPYPLLYSRNSDGSVHTWQVEVSGPKYRFHSGRKNGSIVTSEWTTCTGKSKGKANETSGEAQAAKEAKAALTKKLKGSYWENESDIDQVRFFVSPKMDGLRCIINREGAWSRLGNQFVAFPHIPQELQNLFLADPNLVLDGECYTHALKHDFDKIISLAKKKKPTAKELAESAAKLQYWVFDCPTIPGGYHERYQWMKKNIQEKFKDSSCIKLCEHKLIYSEAELEDYLGECLEKGFEGCMMNLPDGEYEADYRSYNILKYKLFQDAEFVIFDILPGDGNRSGMFGKAIMKMKDGRTFRSGSRGSRELYPRLLAEKSDVIGKEATVRFQNYTPDGIPRFGTIVAIRDYE